MMITPTEDRKTRSCQGQSNTFGLSPGLPEDGGTCPGATCGPGGCLEKRGPIQRTCYAERLARFRSCVGAVLRRITELLERSSFSAKVQLFAQEFSRFLGEKKGEKNYRLHWSGDIPDREYARALGCAIARFPEIRFWGYTRSFFAVPLLAGLKNLRLYLSVDQVNRIEGLAVYRKYRKAGNVHLSFMSRERPTGFREKFLPCPVDTGKLEQLESCHKCRACFHGRTIWFKTR